MVELDGIEPTTSSLQTRSTASQPHPDAPEASSGVQGPIRQRIDFPRESSGLCCRVVTATDGPLLTVREVAARLRVSTAAVYALVEKRQLPHLRVLNAIRVLEADLDAFLAARRRP
ncbi:MAG: helix-turn-helix domain-containing protein [Deltaproteobacteria bacterium]|nr:helix-turn-helix domain-containing protein [Deltaproteobacteria bacterium]